MVFLKQTCEILRLASENSALAAFAANGHEQFISCSCSNAPIFYLLILRCISIKLKQTHVYTFILHMWHTKKII
jgi:hypothetical protein